MQNNKIIEEQDHKNKNKWLDIEKYIQQFLHVNLTPCFSQKTQFCKHELGCAEEILKQSLKSFLMGYGVIAAVDLIALALKLKALKKNPMILLMTLISKKNIRFALFPSLYTLIMKSLTCILRRILKQDNGRIWFISGFIGGMISMMIKEKNNRARWSLFLLTRAIDTFYRYHILKKSIPKAKLDYVIVYAIMIGYTVSVFFTEPSCNSRSLNKSYENFLCEHNGDYRFKKMYMDQMNKKLMIDGFKTDNPDSFINWNRIF